MRWKVFSLSFIIVTLFVVGPLTIPAEAQHPLDGAWTMNFTWAGALAGAAGYECDQCAGVDTTTTLHIVMKIKPLGSFTTDDGGAGTVLYLQGAQKVFLIYTVGCLPIYSGTLSDPTHMAGKMKCRNPNQPGHGTWSAVKQTGKFKR